MGKKGKKGKKKSKAQLEEEARLAAEQARIEEEERLKKEEEERILREEEEAKRKAQLEEFMKQEGERLAEETKEFEDYFKNARFVTDRHRTKVDQETEWGRFVDCVRLPDPRLKSQVMDYIRSIESEHIDTYERAFKIYEKNSGIISEVVKLRLRALDRYDDGLAAIYDSYNEQLCSATLGLLDKAAASLLQNPSEYLNEKNEIQMCKSFGHLKCGLWININKNPRVKSIDMADLGIYTEIPKSLALATAAIRIQVLPPNLMANFTSQNEDMAVGGIITFDLLSLPPTAKRTKTWTIRQVTPLSTNISKLGYPIAPAGTDPSLMRTSSENIPPIRVTCVLEDIGLIYREEQPIVGWWSEEDKSWQQEGISEVTLETMEDGRRKLSFQTTHLTALALLQRRSLSFPYVDWTLRPLGERGNSQVMLTLNTPLGDTFDFEIGEGYVKMCGPEFKECESLLNKEMNGGELLFALKEQGLNIMPQSADLKGPEAKDSEMEKATCKDLASLCSSFLIASSRWNKDAGSSACLARVSEIKDFGRTLPNDVSKIFTKEKKEPPRHVYTIHRQLKGASFVDARNNYEEYKGLPDPTDGPNLYGEVHLCVLALLSESNADGTQERYNHTAARESIELCRTASPVLTDTISSFLYGLRLCSF